MKHLSNQHGFTLLEVLIAVTITALIGVGASQLLSNISDIKTSTEVRSTSLRYLQRMDTFIRKDLWQITGREIKDSYGQYQLSAKTDGDYLFEFSRSGSAFQLLNKSGVSNLQRVAYGSFSHTSEFCDDAIKPLEESEYNNCLVRFFWPVLDRTSDTEPLAQVLLDQVRNVEIKFRGQLINTNNPAETVRSNDWLDEWPGEYLESGVVPDLVQVKLQLEDRYLGRFERVYEVPRFAFNGL